MSEIAPQMTSYKFISEHATKRLVVLKCLELITFKYKPETFIDDCLDYDKLLNKILSTYKFVIKEENNRFKLYIKIGY